LNEPRFKFYVKEGRNYTIKTGVPGVWENVARAIQQQSAETVAKESSRVGAGAVGTKQKLVNEAQAQIKKVKRQTARSTK
jgi:hypothetical protein